MSKNIIYTENADERLPDKVHFPASRAWPHTRLRTLEDCLPFITVLSEELKKKEKRNVRWSHVRLAGCTAHFGMETHLLSRWLPVWGSVHSENTWPAPPSGSHYRVSLSTSLFHPLWQKWQTHFFVHDAFLFICQVVEESLTAWQSTDSGVFCLQNSNLWMDSNGKLWWRHNVLNPSKIVL